jgi:hypothetical protein
MELTWGLLGLLAALIAVAWYWHDALAARELANDAAAEACRGIGASLLDGTVAFRRIQAVRGDGGPLRLRRTYVFDYSRDGNSRQQGFVILTGRAVVSVGL